jgi:hypothetical protein
MKMAFGLYRGLTLLALLIAISFTTNAQTAPGATTIASLTNEVDGVKIHYLKAGQGPAVILLHGYTQTSRMWRPLIPRC